MKNPWLAKNPFLSLWMSGANSMFGAARGHALNEVRRQHRAMMSEGVEAVLAFWSGAAGAPGVKKKTGRRKS